MGEIQFTMSSAGYIGQQCVATTLMFYHTNFICLSEDLIETPNGLSTLSASLDVVVLVFNIK